ncbi:MAG TPA: CHRD domain-containing protein [Trebonia sp.]|nr:CHRD domain-containing protein [Trebonia sp.]
MTIADRLRKRAALAAMTAGGIAVAGAIASAGLALPASATPAAASAAPAASRITLRFALAPMPRGHLVVSPARIKLAEYGFTPGSSHRVALEVLGIRAPLGTLRASSGGSASWSYPTARFTSALRRAEERAGARPPGFRPQVRLMILNAGSGSPVIGLVPALAGPGRYPVLAVEPGYGVIRPGRATLVYNPAAATISVTVNATGFSPGAHAAHIHVGSCQRQGAVVYPFKDFIASSRGVISNQTRTVTGVKSVKLSGGWYLNLHQGNSGDILNRAGQPTINFRPLECAGI